MAVLEATLPMGGFAGTWSDYAVAGLCGGATPDRVQPAVQRAIAGNERRARSRTQDSAEASGPIVASGNRAKAYLLVKRLSDILGAVVLLVLLAPLMLAALVVLLITTRGRPIFVQERLGHCGRPFRMFKFRTMVLGAAAAQQQVKNEQSGPVFKNRRDPRVTRVGRLLRSTSIDEMPQLFNVLLGQMSLVGPRPPLATEVARYQAWQRQRLAVKPGLTCLWQVSGRSEIAFEEWVRMDLWYLSHQNLLTDVKLLLRTPSTVIGRRGAY